MSGKLEGKVAVITGGNSGIGLATAQRFVNEGAYVFITGRRQAELDKATALIGRNVTAVQGDVTSISDLDTLYDTIRREKGHLDVVFANAGGGGFEPFEAVTPESFDATFNLNVRGTFFAIQKALPLLNDGASIIMTGSIAAVKVVPYLSTYGAAKAALRSFARSLTVELKDRGIRTNLLSPGPVETPPMAGFPKEALAALVATIPIGRMGASEELAAAALFLASSESSFITGIELFADGGAAQI
ncbi:MAG: family oxidoreductase [Acidobacteriaceae bacterium]|nr:family oxidoreductase [Acidobacteriaceae bacterium]